MATNNHHTNPGGKKFGGPMRGNSRSQDWNALRLSVASPERILEWSRTCGRWIVFGKFRTSLDDTKEISRSPRTFSLVLR